MLDDLKLLIKGFGVYTMKDWLQILQFSFFSEIFNKKKASIKLRLF